MIEIFEDTEFVTCPICGKEMKYINNFHLRKHGYNSEQEFLRDYPDAELKSSAVRNNIKSHLNVMNSNSEIQSSKGKKGWTPERRKQKSDQMKRLDYMLHNDEKYKDVRKKIYKNRYGLKKKFKKSDGSIIECRSYLEWNIALFLTKNSIEFEYEELQIKYLNPDDNRYHIYIPDFYIPKYNMIIEGKYSDEQAVPSVIAKMNASKKAGYNYIFVDEKLVKDNDKLLSMILK